MRRAVTGGLPPLWCVLTAVAAFGNAPAIAQDEAGAPTITVNVTGSRLYVPAGPVTESVTTITRADIERINPGSAIDLFRQVPGVQVDQVGGPGGFSSVYIRGSDPNHVLVLVDGVRVNDPTNSRGGSFDFTNLDPNEIDRIEVLRGAASAVYGADAMGGVINIVTRGAASNDKGWAGAGLAGIGGIGYRAASGRVGYGSAAGGWSATASTLRDGTDENGGTLRLNQFGLAGRWTATDDLDLTLALRHGERSSSSFPDDSGGLLYAQIRTLDQQRSDNTTAIAIASLKLDTAVLNFALGHYQNTVDTTSPGVAPGVRNEFGIPESQSHTDYQHQNAVVSLSFSYTSQLEFVLGAEWQREHGINQTNYNFFGEIVPADFDLTRDTRSAFGEVLYKPTRALVLRGGLRYDSISDAGSQTSPSVGLDYEIEPTGGALKANYSTGFKPPSFFALGLPVPLGGNPNLLPEKSRGYSVGYDQPLLDGRANVSGALFQTHYTDLVTFDNETNQIVNAKDVNIRGFEIEGYWQVVPQLQLRGQFTRLLSHIVDSDEPLRQRPGKRATVQVDWLVRDDVHLILRTEYSADVFDSSIPTGNLYLPTYLRTDLTSTWQINPNWTLSATVDNLFDRLNENYVGMPGQQRRLRVALSGRF